MWPGSPHTTHRPQYPRGRPIGSCPPEVFSDPLQRQPRLFAGPIVSSGSDCGIVYRHCDRDLEILEIPRKISIATRSRRSEEHTSELQSHSDLVCRLLLEKKKKKNRTYNKIITKE